METGPVCPAHCQEIGWFRDSKHGNSFQAIGNQPWLSRLPSLCNYSPD